MRHRILLPALALMAASLAGASSVALGDYYSDEPQLADALQDQPSLPPVVVEPQQGAEAADAADMAEYDEGYDSGYSEGFAAGARRGYSRGQQSGLWPNGIPWNSNQIYRDSQLVGPYNQPVWTTQRPFATTRAYVLPPGTMQLEQWARPTWKKGEAAEWRMLEELAIGLPGRFQLDVYERWNIEEFRGEQRANQEGVQVELRWALANWGVIPFNPTLYAEWVERGGPQEKPNKYELKLLLSEQLSENLFYASNLILEQETSGERENELGWSHALSVPIVQRKLLAGVECVWSGTNTVVDRNRSNEFLIGPSMQYRPTNRTFLDVVGLFGTTSESPEAQMYIIFGYQFGNRAGPASSNIVGPASTRGN